jgi:hypothetical protein
VLGEDASASPPQSRPAMRCGAARKPTCSGWPARPAAHQAREMLPAIPAESRCQTLIGTEQSPA